MAGNSVIRLSRDGPEGTGLTFWGHLENENVIDGEPTEIGHNYFTERFKEFQFNSMRSMWDGRTTTVEALARKPA